MEQKPSIGRIVIFKGEAANGVTEHPAVITRVWSDTCVNLTVFFDAKAPEVRTSVTRTDTTKIDSGTWGWEWPVRS